MRILIPLVAVLALAMIAYAGVKVANLQFLFGVVIPYIAVAFFILGFIYRVIKWGRAPVPFRIPTVTGQQKSLPWIKHDKLGSPATGGWAVGRLLLEVFLFRSLFMNQKTEMTSGQKAVYGSNKWLWLAGIVFHYSFLVVLLRHGDFFVQQAPFFIDVIKSFDGFFEIGVPKLYLSGAALFIAALYLFSRRVFIPQVKYISLASDYFPLFLIMGIALSGILMRYFFMVDLYSVKKLAVGLLSFSPVVPEGIGAVFYVHIFLVSALLAYFPMSKLMHMGGVFMSPTINMVNNSRMVRHVNPWNYPVHVHTYEEYEDEFRDKMIDAGIPVDKKE